VSRAGFGLALLFGLVGCGGIASVEGQPDPAQIPSGALRVVDADGPVTEVGSGRTLGIGWRYAIYESADGICTQLELANVTSAGCGTGPLISEGSVFGGVGGTTGLAGPGVAADTPTPVDGIVTSQVDAVWIVAESGARLPTTLMSLEGAGHDAQAFVGFVPAGERAARVVATDGDGEVLEAFELP
jgi:hypothetical protein